MFFHGFPSFSATKSAPRTSSSQPEPVQPTLPAPTPSRKPSRIQKVLQALRLSRSHSKVEEHHHQPQVVQTSPVPSQRPCPATRQATARSAPAEPSATSTSYSFPNSTFSTTGPTQSTTPATTYQNTPAASASSSPFLATDPAAASTRIAELESTISRLEQDYNRQTSQTNELLNNKLFGQMIALVEERDGDKAGRKLAEDRLAEVVASHAKAEEVLRQEREQHRKAKSVRSQTYYALEKENTDLQAALLDAQAKADLLHVEALQKALVRLGIVDPDDQQYPLAYPVCGDCIGPFLKAVCTAARQGARTNLGSTGEPEHELATAVHQTFEVPGDEDGCSEPVSDSRARARSKAPAPTEWLKGGSTRTRSSVYGLA